MMNKLIQTAPIWMRLTLLAWMIASPASGEVETIYVIPTSHLDIGFTAPPSAVAAKMREAAEKALEQAAADPAYIWNFENFWQLEQWWEADASLPKRARMLELIRTGRFSVGAAYATPHTAVMNAWSLDWLFRLPVSWGKQHGLQLKAAILDDVPGHPIDLPHFMVQNGVRYLIVGANLTFSRPLPEVICNTPFWWEAPSGERVLTWISNQAYTEAYMKMGFDPDSARFFNKKEFPDADPMKIMEKGIGTTLRHFEQKGYPYDAILRLHAFDNWGALASTKVPRFAKMWNDAHVRPKIVPATPQMFFEHIEAKYGKDLPVYRGGFGGQWDAIRAAIPTAMRAARNAEEILRGQKKPSIAQVRNLLVFYEHSFGGGSGWPGLLTRQECVQHNREHFEILASLPGARNFIESEKRKSEAAARAYPRTASPPTALESDALYVLSTSPMFIAPNEGAFTPMPSRAWVGFRAVAEGKASRKVSYWIDRRQLPDPAHVVWLHALDDKRAAAKVRNRTAAGWELLPDDGLAGYDWGGWISPLGFRLGDQEFSGDGLIAFRRVTLAGRPWLMGLCLGQRLSTTFKASGKGSLTFEEAYPTEARVVEISVTIRDVR